MCRSIRRLREGTVAATDEEIREAALQFVRKISGYGKPSPANEEVFDRAVDDIARTSSELLSSLTVGGRSMAEHREPIPRVPSRRV
jgi:hypothetical protein